jgi:enamine deaminase RidA (YjgF/YER057c/UK114 family)
MLGTNAEGELVSTDVVGQMERALQNIEIVLESTGLTFAQVVKVVIYLRDIEDRLKINPLRQRFFGESRPASTLVEVSALAIPAARVEIDAIAYAG